MHWNHLFASLLLAAAAGQAAAEEDVDYAQHVKPILKTRCYACHGALKQEGGLRLDAVALMLRGGDSGAAITAGKPGDSPLWQRVTDKDESSRMPQEGPPLAGDEIAKITAWIRQGAPAPENDQPESDPRQHWAFRRPVRPQVPTAHLGTPNSEAGTRQSALRVSHSAFRVRNSIDSFIAAEHEKHGLRPAGEIDKGSLLRRVYLDLIGLPPTREELHTFLHDTSTNAYEKVVDRLLASPQYGERWGRHWMDVWRYSDWYGRRAAPDVLNSYPTIWRWRDWIVRSLNKDKPYDRMIVEMLAADEVAPEDDQNIVATGFIVRNFFKWNYNQWMRDNVEHTGKAFLGLTLNCAHCHDHKYDPISQEEYFAFRAFFEPLELRQDRVPGEPDPGKFEHYVYLRSDKPIPGGMIRVFDEKLDAKTMMYSRGDERNVIEGKLPVEPRVPAVFGIHLPPIEPVKLPPVAVYPGLKPFIAKEELAKSKAAISQAERKVAEANGNLQSKQPALVAEVEAAEARLAKLAAGMTDDGPSQALVGKQSLFLDAMKGRRTLTHAVSALGAARDGTSISFQLVLLADGHTNFQLALNTATGATATFIGFEKGRIIAYRPGSHEIVEIGRYNFAGGQNRFQVTATLDVTNDQLAFTVKSLSDQVSLVDGAKTPLHGWNPEGRPEQGIVLDARPGTICAFDDLMLAHPRAEPVVRFGFEAPTYAAGQDAVGREGWTASPICVAPAISVVDRRGTPVASVVAVRQQVRLAQRRLDALRLAVPAAETALVAAQQESTSLQARIAAGEARYKQAEHATPLAREASRAERTAAHAKAVAEEQAAELALAEIEAKPGDDKQRAAAQARCDKAQQAVVTATEGIVGDKEEFTLLTPTYPDKSTGRRTVLARAIAHRDNPLTARVAVNHIWTRHFGRPLVESVFDFGLNGKQPTHPELLDWMAVELMDSGWSMKHLHRLIVTSGTYRMDSKAVADSRHVGNLPETPTQDRANFYLSFPRRRMEAEVVRDSLLHLAGRLDATLGGQEIEQKDAAGCRRRSMYISHHGERRAEFLETFNVASPTECYCRIETVVPQQALALANSEVASESSRALARELWQRVVSEIHDEQQRDAEFIDAAYEQVLTRLPQPPEREESLAFLQRQVGVYRSAGLKAEEPAIEDGAKPSADPTMRARESLVHALFSHHDFISIR